MQPFSLHNSGRQDIYTRVGDTNTDINKSADINNIEYLWKKRFFLTRTPFEQAIKKLGNRSEWKRQDDTYFNSIHPEFTITIEDVDEELGPEFYSYAMMNESTMYQILNINYYGTKLYSRQKVVLDGGRYTTPIPEWGFIYFSDYKTQADYSFKYFTKDDPSYKLNEFFIDSSESEAREARRRFFEVVLLFENSEEKSQFLSYVQENEDQFNSNLKFEDNNYNWIESSSKLKDEQITIRLRTGKALNRMLANYRALLKTGRNNYA